MKTTKNTIKNGHIFQFIIQNFDNWWFWIRRNKCIAYLIMEQDDIHKIYLYAKDLSEPKHEFLIKKCKDVGIKYCNDQNSFIECSNRMDDVYQNIVDYNPSKKRKILIAVDDMIADIMTNKKFQTRIKELFIRCRKVTCFYHSVLFFYPERCQIKFNTLFDYENQQQQRITKYCD